MRLVILFTVNAALACVGCECSQAASVPDASALTYRQDACARWLMLHGARGCDLDTWQCPIDVNGPPLTSQEVSDCEADLLASEGCSVPACEVSP
jgi:hypothetical protein